MNSEQQTVSLMVLLLIAFTTWFVYRKQLAAILFTPPLSAPPTSNPVSGLLPGSALAPLLWGQQEIQNALP
jgi:hypothetical protein